VRCEMAVVGRYRSSQANPLLGAERPIPSFEEGAPRQSSKMQRYLKIGVAREVRHLLQERFDLPGRADFVR